jgi:fluoroquinolone resistance protein
MTDKYIIRDKLYDFYAVDEYNTGYAVMSSFFVAIANHLFLDGKNIDEFLIKMEIINKKNENGRIDNIFILKKEFIHDKYNFLKEYHFIINLNVLKKDQTFEQIGDIQFINDEKEDKPTEIDILFYGGKYYLIKDNLNDKIKFLLETTVVQLTQKKFLLDNIIKQSTQGYYNIYAKFFKNVSLNFQGGSFLFQDEYNKLKNPSQITNTPEFITNIEKFYKIYIYNLCRIYKNSEFEVEVEVEVDNVLPPQNDLIDNRFFKKIETAIQHYKEFVEEKDKLLDTGEKLETLLKNYKVVKTLEKFKNSIKIIHTKDVKINPYSHYIIQTKCDKEDEYLEHYKKLEHIYQGITLSQFNFLCEIKDVDRFPRLNTTLIELDIILGLSKNNITIETEAGKKNACQKQFYWPIKPLQQQRKLQSTLDVLKEHHYEGIFKNYSQLNIKDFTQGKAQHGGFGQIMEILKFGYTGNKYIKYPGQTANQENEAEVKKDKKFNRTTTKNKIVRIIIQDLIYKYFKIQQDSGKKKLDFNGLDLGGLYISGTTKTKIIFKNCNFEDTYLQNTIFKNIDFTKAKFKGSDLTNVIFENCILEKADFSSCIMTNIEFKKTDITKAKAKFHNTQLSEEYKHITEDELLELSNKIKLESYNLRHKTFSNKPFDNYNFSNCDLTGTSFSNCTFNNCTFNNIYAYKDESFDKLTNIESNIDKLLLLIEDNIKKLAELNKLSVTTVKEIIYELINGIIKIKGSNISFYNDRSMRYYDRTKMDKNYKLQKIARTDEVQSVWKFLRKLDLSLNESETKHYATVNFHRILFTKLSHKYGEKFKIKTEAYFLNGPFIGLNFSKCTFKDCNWEQKNMTQLKYLKSSEITLESNTSDNKNVFNYIYDGAPEVTPTSSETASKATGQFLTYGCVVTSRPLEIPYGIKCFNIYNTPEIENYKIIDGKLFGPDVDLSSLVIDGGNEEIKDMKLGKSDFNGTTFKNICFRDVDFSNCNLDNSEFYNVQFIGNTKVPNFKNVKSDNIYIVCHGKSNINLLPLEYLKNGNIIYIKGILSNEGMDLSNKRFENVDFRFHNIQRSKLTNTQFTNCTFSDQQKRVLKFRADNTTLTPFVDNLSQKFNYDKQEFSDLDKTINYNFYDTKLGNDTPNDTPKDMSNLIIINNITNIDFKNLRLTNLKIGRKFINRKYTDYKTLIKKCDFRNTNIPNATFLNVEFKLCRFGRSIATNDANELQRKRDLNKDKIIAKDCVFRKCNLDKRNWEGSTFTNCIFHGGGKSAGGGAEFKECDLTGCKFIECEFYSTTFKESIMNNVEFTGCKFKFPSQWQGIKMNEGLVFTSCLVEYKNTLALGSGISIVNYGHMYNKIEDDNYCFEIINATENIERKALTLVNFEGIDSRELVIFTEKTEDTTFDGKKNNKETRKSNIIFKTGVDWSYLTFKNTKFDNVTFSGNFTWSKFENCTFEFCKIEGDFSNVTLNNCKIYLSTKICTKNLKGIKTEKLNIYYDKKSFIEIRHSDKIKLYENVDNCLPGLFDSDDDDDSSDNTGSEDGDSDDGNSKNFEYTDDTADTADTADTEENGYSEWFIYLRQLRPTPFYTFFVKEGIYENFIISNRKELLKINLEGSTFDDIRFGYKLKDKNNQITVDDNATDISKVPSDYIETDFKTTFINLIEDKKTKFHFKDSNFKNTKFINTKPFYGTFENCDFSIDEGESDNLEDNKLEGINYNECIFDSCIFTNRIFEKCNFEVIKKCTLNCTFTECTFKNTDFQSCKITKETKFINCKFINTRLINIEYTNQPQLTMEPKNYQTIVNNNKISVIGDHLLICGVELTGEINVSLKNCIFNKIIIDNKEYTIKFNNLNKKWFFKEEGRGLTIKSKGITKYNDNELPDGWKVINGYLLGPNSEPLDLNGEITSEDLPLPYKIVNGQIIGPYVNIKLTNGLDLSKCILFRITSSGNEVSDISLPDYYGILGKQIVGPNVIVNSFTENYNCLLKDECNIKFDNIKIDGSSTGIIFGKLDDLFLSENGIAERFHSVTYDNELYFLFSEEQKEVDRRILEHEILWGKDMKHTENEVKLFNINTPIDLSNSTLKNCIIRVKNELQYLENNFIYDGKKENIGELDFNKVKDIKNFKIININKNTLVNDNIKPFVIREDLEFRDIINEHMNGLNLGFRLLPKFKTEACKETHNKYEITGLLIENVNNESIIRVRFFNGPRFKRENRAFKAQERQSKERAGSEVGITKNKLNIQYEDRQKIRDYLKGRFTSEYIKFDNYNGFIIGMKLDNIETLVKYIDFDETILKFYTEKSKEIPREYISRYNKFRLDQNERTHLIGPNMDYSGENLSGLEFPKVSLENCNFTGAKLYDADLSKVSNLATATFVDVYLNKEKVTLPKDCTILEDIYEDDLCTIIHTNTSQVSVAGKRGNLTRNRQLQNPYNDKINLDLLLKLCTNHKYRQLLPININKFLEEDKSLEKLEEKYQEFLEEEKELEKQIMNLRNLKREDTERGHQIFLDTHSKRSKNKIGKAIGKNKIKVLKKDIAIKNHRLNEFLKQNDKWKLYNESPIRYINKETNQILSKQKLFDKVLTLESEYTNYSVKDLINLLRGCSITTETGPYLGIGAIIDGKTITNIVEKDLRFTQFINCTFNNVNFDDCNLKCASFEGCEFNGCRIWKCYIKGLRVVFAYSHGGEKPVLEITIRNEGIKPTFIKDCHFKVYHLVGDYINTSSNYELDASFYKMAIDPNDIWKFNDGDGNQVLVERGNYDIGYKVDNITEIKPLFSNYKRSDNNNQLQDQNKVDNSNMGKEGISNLRTMDPKEILVKNRFSRNYKKTINREVFKIIQQKVTLYIETELSLKHSNLEGVSLYGSNKNKNHYKKIELENTNCVDTEFNELNIEGSLKGIFKKTKFTNCKSAEEQPSTLDYNENGKDYMYLRFNDGDNNLLVLGKGINLEGKDLSKFGELKNLEGFEMNGTLDLSKDMLYDVKSQGQLFYENIELPIEYCILDGWLLGEGVNAEGIFTSEKEVKTAQQLSYKYKHKSNNLDKKKLDDKWEDRLRFLNFSFANFKYGDLGFFPDELFNSIPYYYADLSYTNFGTRYIEFDKLRSLKSRAVGKQIIFENSNMSKANLEKVHNPNVIKMFNLESERVDDDDDSEPKLLKPYIPRRYNIRSTLKNRYNIGY